MQEYISLNTTCDGFNLLSDIRDNAVEVKRFNLVNKSTSLDNSPIRFYDFETRYSFSGRHNAASYSCLFNAPVN